MQGEIEFRGKRIDNGEFVYGNLIRNYYLAKIQTHIIDDDCDITVCADGELIAEIVEVNPSSVGQFIGHKDMDGTKIYENDVLEHTKTKARYKVVWDSEIVGYALQGEAITVPTNQYRLNVLRVVKEESQ